MPRFPGTLVPSSPVPMLTAGALSEGHSRSATCESCRSTMISSESPSVMAKVMSALFYGVASIVIMFVNKILLTNYRFPSFLFVGVGQMAATIVILFVSSSIGVISYPKCDRTIPRKIFPLPLIYVVNLVSGLGGTKMISLPMFTVLRRFSILMTMILEYFILGIRSSFGVRLSIGLMIAGSMIAALYDLSFDAYGYVLIFINDLCTAGNGVYMKQKLDAKDLGKNGLLYYNSLFMLLPALALATVSDDLDQVSRFVADGGVSTGLVVCFLLSCVCGFILNYSLVLCTHYNSALTTTCVGPIKNLIVTYVGMWSSGDYIFQWANFIGINVSVLGSILYTYITFRSPTTGNQRMITISPVKRDDDKPLLT